MTQKKQALSKNAQQAALVAELKRQTGLDIQVGDIFIDDDGRYLKATALLREGKEIKVKLEICDSRGKITSSWGTIELSRFVHREYIKVTEPIEDLEAQAIAALSNLDQFDEEKIEADDTSTALTTAQDKNALIGMRDRMQERRDLVAKMEAVIKRKMNALNNYVQAMQEKIEAAQKVIGAFEVYLGVYQDIVQIREGALAPATTPIALRQQILYMDEEAGNYEDGGIDFQRIEDFDHWIVQPANLHRVLPETKGVVAIRISRQKRNYSNSPWLNASLNAKNMLAYLLIRNGDRLLRIWLDLTLDKRLYPSIDEMESIRRSIEKDWGFTARDAGDKEFDYKKNVLILQGLLDRTEVFQPLPIVINLLGAGA